MNSGKTKKVALVTGSSSGIGFEFSLTLARNGFFTYATMRNLDKSKNIVALADAEKLPLEVVQLDINDYWSIRNVIDKIADKQCAVDVLVNNAGYALVRPVEELSVQEFKEQFETNVFGVVRVIQEILPTMRMRKSGIIVNISSINGRVGFPLTPAYVSSKFALEGLSESLDVLSLEIEQFGINVILIEPGIIKSNFINNLKIGKNVYTGDGKSPYGHITKKRISGFKPRFENGLHPVEVAKVVLYAITSKKLSVESRYVVGDDAFKLIELRQNRSDKEFRRLVMEAVLK